MGAVKRKKNMKQERFEISDSRLIESGEVHPLCCGETFEGQAYCRYDTIVNCDECKFLNIIKLIRNRGIKNPSAKSNLNWYRKKMGLKD